VDIKLIGIVGAGTMGNGIAQVAAVGGFAVLMRDTSNALVDKGIANVSRNLERMLAKEKITAAGKETILSRIKGVTALEELAAADLVIEAVTERMDVKLEVFKGLNTICRPETILASNTSSLSLTQLATASGRPDKVVGMHFFNPVPVMRLVEIIRALQTSDDTFQSVRKLTEDLGKEPVSVKDSPGFVVNRMLVPMINEAVFT
jgi:3-hydroxybutyryl-CoA dehydrogenase